MKHIITGLILVFLTGILSAQSLPPAKDIPKEYRKEFRDNRKDYRQNTKKADRWDIVLDPIESVPIAEYFGIQSPGNWGQDLLFPPDLAAEVVQRASRPGRIKIGDTGRTTHPDLNTGWIWGENYTTDKSIDDAHGHSTHVTGIIYFMLKPLIDAGLITWENDKVLSDNGSGSFTWVANFIVKEDEENANLIKQGHFVIANLSLGGGTDKIGIVEEALRKSRDLGVVYVCAAGNSGNAVQYPGNSVYTSAVSSIDPNLVISSFSSRGPEIENTAPGRSITSTWKGGGYATLSGTSMAAPFVTALTAIAMSVYPELNSINDIRAYFQKISVNLGEPGRDDLYGWGLVYVQAILDTPPTTEEPKPGKWRRLAFPFTGPYTMPWMETGHAVAADEADIFHFLGDVFGMNNRTLIISEMEIQAVDQYPAAIVYDRLQAGLDEFFSGTGLGLPPGSDHRDAAYYLSYFLDLFLDKQYGLNVTIKRIVAENESASPILLYEQDMKRHGSPVHRNPEKINP